MIEKLIPLALPSGFYNNGTTYQAKGRWFRGSLVRFFQGTIQPVGGWVAFDVGGVDISGVCRAMLSYQKYDGTFLTVVGSTGGLYAIVYDPTGPSYAISDITPVPLVDTLSGGTDDTLTWSLSSFGNFVIATYQFEGPPADLGSGAGGGLLTVWEGDPLIQATYASEANQPFTNLASFVTPEKFVVSLGGNDPNNVITPPTDEPDVRLVWWPTQATTDDWVPSDINSAGSFSLPSPGTLKCGAPIRGQSLIWTTRDLWAMTYVGQPLIYSFQQVGVECGIISSHAFAITGNASFWMGNNRFFRYDGFVSPIQCDVADYVFGNMNASYQWKIWALHNPEFSEVTWFYVSSASTEIDSYVTFNYIENHWVFGSLARTCGIPAAPPGLVPVMVDPDSVFYNHETGTIKGGASTYLESGPMELQDGDNVARIQRLVPDDKTLGDVNATIFTSLFPDAAEASHGPYPLANPTSIRMTARQARLRLDEVNAVAWRVGTVRLGIIPGGTR